jgi:hypothetical protein
MTGCHRRYQYRRCGWYLFVLWLLVLWLKRARVSGSTPSLHALPVVHVPADQERPPDQLPAQTETEMLPLPERYAQLHRKFVNAIRGPLFVPEVLDRCCRKIVEPSSAPEIKTVLFRTARPFSGAPRVQLRNGGCKGAVKAGRRSPRSGMAFTATSPTYAYMREGTASSVLGFWRQGSFARICANVVIAVAMRRATAFAVAPNRRGSTADGA